MPICVVVNGKKEFLTRQQIADAEFDPIQEKFQIKIKKANRGKFKASAKSAGMTTLAYADKVLSDPNSSPKLIKRANFAKNAITKFKH